ncbi:MAG TPA: hypothetical protein VN428_00120 [Bryobacteraceae bacterium]|nr:hypothetical protein [Bryobacteraceae bacterium]
MRLPVTISLLTLIIVPGLFAQQPAARTLEQAGIALPRAAQDEPADGPDLAILERTLYGRVTVEELDEEQASEMVAAAQRMLARRKDRLERARKLSDDGVLPRLEVTSYVEELDRVRRIYDQAELRANLARNLAEIARLESAAEQPQVLAGPLPLIEKFSGNGNFLNIDFHTVSRAYELEFGRSLPVSARGATRYHRMLGFDHRGRVDVAIDPDQAEGVWLRNYLQTLRIPYYAFRQAVPGKASARHIHIGPPSERLPRGN